jgi:MFS family permease
MAGSQSRAETFRAVTASRNLVRLQLALTGSMLGGWAWSVALAVWAYDAGGTGLVGVATASRYVPMAIGALFAGAVVDRYGRRPVMVGSDVARCGLLALVAVAIATGAPEVLVLVLVGLTSLFGSVFRPAEAALVPSLAETPAQLTASNALSGFVEHTGMFLGPAIGGVILTVSSAQVVFALSSATLVWSALLVGGIKVDDPRRARHELVHPLVDAARGLRLLGADRTTGVLSGLLTAQTVVAGALNVLLVVIALEMLDKGDGWVGYLNAAMGIGGVIGAAACAGLVGRERLSGAFGLGMLLWGLPFLLIAAVTSPVVALLAIGLVGVGNSVGDLAGFTMLQRAVPEDQLARLFGALLESAGVETTLVIVGLFLPVLTVLLWGPMRAIDAAARPAEEALAVLRRLPMFGLLPPTSIEQLALGATRVEIAPGEVVFSQGDVGDRYYAIESGSVAVEIDGLRVRVQEPGSGFGEIALLRDTPRTATIRAAEETVLWAVERDRFLAAVTGSAPASEHAAQLVSSRLQHAAPRMA